MSKEKYTNVGKNKGAAQKMMIMLEVGRRVGADRNKKYYCYAYAYGKKVWGMQTLGRSQTRNGQAA